MTKTYLITLSPMGKFFFGGDMTFTLNGKDSENSSYFIKSNRYPQQTSLLGMLRFLILTNAETDVFCDGKITDREKASKLIGESSFKVGNMDALFGAIERITPCFLMNEKAKEPTLPVNAIGKEWKFEVHEDGTINSDYEAEKSCKDFDEDIFLTDLRNGITKTEKHEKKDRALFKQENLIFNNFDKDGNKIHDYKFAFYAEVDEEVDLEKYSGQLVSLGADSSVFAITIKENVFKEPTVSSCDKFKGEYVVLTSPSYIEDVDKLNVAFAITKVVPFKFLQTTIDTKSYNRINKAINASKRYNLYDRGSVFFFKNAEDKKKFIEKLKSRTDFRQIGYNYHN